MTSPSAGDPWRAVCRIDDLEVGRGATALVHGQAIAVFRVSEGTIFALGNHDPFADPHDGGLARGIVGRRGGVPFVGSTAHRHVFDLRTGQCLDQPQVAVPAYDARVWHGVVQIGLRKAQAA